MGLAVRPDDHPKHHCALVLRLARFFRIFRIGGEQRAGSADSATHPVSTAADAATPARTDAGTAPGSDPTTRTTSDSTTRACAVRRRPEHVRKRVTELSSYGKVNLRRHHYCGLYRQLRVVVTNHHRGRRDLFIRKLGQRAF